MDYGYNTGQHKKRATEMEKKFVLWGHHLKDYSEMFDLSRDDLSLKIIEYGAGATSFNAEMNQKGVTVKSCDPIFHLKQDDLINYSRKTFEQTVKKMKGNPQKHCWKTIGEFEEMIESRRKGIELFLDDYPQGKLDGRYQQVQPNSSLPFEDYQFELALITHHLFVNYGEKGVEEHLTLILELLRVAGEVRIFPLLDKNGGVSKLLGPVMLKLQQENLSVEVRQVASQIQKSGNAMMRVWATECDV